MIMIMSGIQDGRYVLKKMKEDQIRDTEELFHSVEGHIGRGGGTPHMTGVGMLVGNFELNP